KPLELLFVGLVFHRLVVGIAAGLEGGLFDPGRQEGIVEIEGPLVGLDPRRVGLGPDDLWERRPPFRLLAVRIRCALGHSVPFCSGSYRRRGFGDARESLYPARAGGHYRADSAKLMAGR